MRLFSFLLLMFCLSGCRLLGIDTSIPCKTNADCSANESTCTNGFCAATTTGEGEGVAAGEGEGAAAEGEGEGVAGEGEGEGVAGEGEGEGEGPPPLVDFTPALDQPVDVVVGGVTAGFVIDVSDCSGSSCASAPGPDGRTIGAVTSPLVVTKAEGIPQKGALILEAVIDLPVTPKTFPPPTAPAPLFTIVDGSGTSAAKITASLAADPDVNIADLDLSVHFDDGSGTSVTARRHLGPEARGWMHLFCGVDTRKGAGFQVAECFLNAERFGIEHAGSTFSVQSTNNTNTTVDVPYAEIALWNDSAYDAIVSSQSPDPLVAPDLLMSAARARLAQWSGVPSSPVPPLFTNGADEIAMRDGFLGAVSLLGPGAADAAVTWLMPGWPRVVDDGGTAALLIEEGRTNLIGDGVTPFTNLGCTAVLGPSDDALDAFKCPGGTSTANGTFAVGGFDPRTASLVASLGAATGTAVVTFGSTCTFTLHAATASPSGGARCTVETLAPSSSSSGARWFRLSAPAQNTMSLTTDHAALFAYPQGDSGSQATTPLLPANSAAPDRLAYPIADAPTASFDLLASLDAPKSDTQGAIATLITDAMPTADAQLFIDGSGKINLSTSTFAFSNDAQPFIASALWEARLNPGSAPPCGTCTKLDVTVPFASPPALLFIIGGALAAQNNLLGIAVQQNIYAVKNLSLSIPTGTLGAATPTAVDVAYTGVVAGGVATVPSVASFGTPAQTFDANHPQSFVGAQPGCSTPPTAPAPTPVPSVAFAPSDSCAGLATNSPASLGNRGVLFDAFFQAVPTTATQLIVGFEDQNIAFEIPPVTNKRLAFRIVEKDNSFDVTPSSATTVGYEGWDYVACFLAANGDPTCNVNMQPATVVQNGAGAQLDAQGDLIGASQNGGNRAAGPIAFAHAWAAPQGFALSGENPGDLVRRLAAANFGIEPTSGASGPTPSFTRAAPATVTLLDRSSNYVLFDTGRDYPGTAIIDATSTPGYVGEPDAQNHLGESVAMTTAPWTATLTTASPAGTGPRPNVELALIEPTGSVSQNIQVSTAFANESADGGHFDVVASAWFQLATGTQPTMELDFGGTQLIATIAPDGCTLGAAGAPATCTLTSRDASNWQRASVATQVGTAQSTITFKISEAGTLGVLATAPQLEVGTFATSYQPTSSAINVVRRAVDDLEYTLNGPASIAGTFDLTATVPNGLPTSQIVVLATVVQLDNTFRPMFDWRNNHVLFPEFIKQSADAADTVVGTTVDLQAEWRHGTALVQIVEQGGTLSAATPTANGSIDDVPATLVVGGTGKSSALSCNTCSVGATVSHVNVTFAPNIP
jgi:hypothetical protein